MKRDLPDRFIQFSRSVQEYITTRVKLIKIRALDKMTRISVFIISMVGFLILGILLFQLASAAFIVWYGEKYGNYLTGILLLAGFIVAAGVLLYLFRRTILSSFLIRNFSRILFEDDDEMN